MTSRSPIPRRTVLGAAGLGVVVTFVAACSGEQSPEGAAATTEDSDPTEAPETAADTASPTSGVDAPQTIVATSVVGKLSVFTAPDDPDILGQPGSPEQVLDRSERVTGQLVLLALDVGAAWTHVQLPIRPNGSTGWVRSSEVSLSGHNFSIDVDLAGHEIVVINGGQEVLRSPIGVGRADRPTPGGDYFITELLQPPEPDGLYGPYAYGLSGYSDVLMDFKGGEGVIGIHGTNEPDLVGSDVSSGCIRLPNAEITALVDTIGVPLGTPVTIRA
ncbi:MAG: L,D-transpeptidase [Ornithinimicrobium sp.]